MSQHIPQVRVFSPEATYFLWMDFRFLGMSDEELEEACEVFTLPSGGYLIVEG